jgi:competence protein ComEC
MAHLGRRLGFAERQIDLIALTHPHDDHVAGLVEVLGRYSVRQVLEGAVQVEGNVADRWRAAIRARDVPTTTGATGMVWQLDHEVYLDVFAIPAVPGSRADTLEPAGALVLRLRYGSTSLLLPGDLVAEQALRLVRTGNDLTATALVVPHHGSRTGLDAGLLAAIAPQAAVVSVGERNRFGHPAPQTLALLATAGVPLWRTDQAGTIELVSDGRSWQVFGAGKGR